MESEAPRPEARPFATWLLIGLLGLPALAHAVPPQGPGELRLLLHGSNLHWELEARADLQVLEVRILPGNPSALTNIPRFPDAMQAGETQEGVVALSGNPSWLELRLYVRSRFGAQWIGATVGTRAGPASGTPLRVLAKPESPTTPGFVQARFVYEDRLLGVSGYTGTTQWLPLRQVDVELIDAAGRVRAAGRLNDAGDLLLPTPPDAREALHLRLWTSTRESPEFDLAVLDRSEDGALHRHMLETPAFECPPTGLDLGTFVLSDPDGFGQVQAFHILDVALDAMQMLATADWLGAAPRDSLRFIWGPELRIRGSSTVDATVQVTSPGVGDTDGWSDPVILHEIGHFVARRYGRDDSAGGLHFLGDVEQDLSLAFSEGWATAFAARVRAWRASSRRNLSGAPMDAAVSWYIDAGMPPPLGIAGGLQLGWDLETSTWLDGRPLLRQGMGSESTVAAVLWDLVDDAGTPDASPGGDDDGARLAPSRWWRVLPALRELPGDRRITLEDYWRVASSLFDAEEMRLLQRVFLEQGHVEFMPDADEPDDGERPPRVLTAGFPARVPGDIVIDEVDVGISPAVELTNRGTQWISLFGWRLHARRNGATTNPGLTLRFPPGVVLAPGARLVLHRRGRPEDSTPRHLLVSNWTMPWFPESDGALILEDEQGRTRDFVRWSSIDSVPSQTPIPADTRFDGSLRSPGFGRTLSRLPRVDSDQSSDFVASPPTLGAPNDVESVHHTFFPAGDRDGFRFVAARSGTYTIRTLALRNGAEPLLELHATDRARLIPRRTAPDGQAEVSVWLHQGEVLGGWLQHVGESTSFGVYDLAIYAEPEDRVLLAPEGIQIERPNPERPGEVRLTWWNGGAYDSTSVWIDGSVSQVLPGGATQWQGNLVAGSHRVRLVAHVQGYTSESPELVVNSGNIPVGFAEDFEVLSSSIWEAQSPWAVAPAPWRSGRALTTATEGPYAAGRRAVVRLLQAVEVEPGTTLHFDHICIVRPEDQASLEISEDAGARWVRLASWNLLDHRGEGESSRWSDGSADSSDWVHETFDLAAYVGQSVQVRFFFESDPFGNAAGWWIDALRLGNEAAVAPRFDFEPATPNPFNSGTRLQFVISHPGAVLLQVFDVRGRLIRDLWRGELVAGPHRLTWDGRNAAGLPMASGVYFVRLESGGRQAQQKVVLLR